MDLTSCYPVLMSSDVTGASAFYRETFGFEVTFESDWYVSLRRDRFELALLAHDHATVPEGYRDPPGVGLVNLEVTDADAVYRDVIDRCGLEPVVTLRDEDFGQRHFILAGPDRTLVDVIQPIPPTPDFRGTPA